ncbi:MAG: immunoglobulin domain-containing protein [Verrucomicrobia bacterium]|nr:immunoglobulin domain-containing protein [Verrucomicrobiota bacterium]
MSDSFAQSAPNPFRLTPLWSGVPAGGNYVTSTGGGGTPNERSFAFSSLSNHLYVVQRSANNYTIHVLDAENGKKLYNLKTNGIIPVVASEISGANGIGLVAIDVADDGAVYACNSSPNAGGGQTFAESKLFRVYRWANAHSNTAPVQIFSGDPAGQTDNFRWGDALDARGRGTDTQLLLDNQNAAARYVAILTPKDATFSSFNSRYFIQDPANAFGASIGRTLEFGAGNTFWQKRKSPAGGLLNSSFALNSPPESGSTVVATYAAFPDGIGPVAVDATRKLLAGIDFTNVTTTPDTLDLYDISDLNNPLLLAQYKFPINHVANNNFIGRVLFAGDKLFALNGNNGFLAFRISSGPPKPPSILGQPQDPRTVKGGSFTLSVVTADLATYQWQKNQSNIAGATNASYTVANAQASDAGTYRVMASNEAGATTSSNAVVTVLPADQFHRLQPLWSTAPGAQLYVTSDGGSNTPNERNIAFNSLSNQLYVVQRQGADFYVHVVNPDNGNPLYTLNTMPIFLSVPAFSGSTGIAIDGIDVADDGAIYASNMTADACGCANPDGIFRVYRWANSNPNTVPVEIFQGEPSGQAISLRWGDVLDARGKGTDTQLLLDNNQGSHAAILSPTSPAMTTFTPVAFPHSSGSGSIGRSLEFGSGDTMWQKRKSGALHFSTFDLAKKTSAPMASSDAFPVTLGPVAVDAERKLVAGLEFSASPDAPDTINLYDITDPQKPLLLGKHNFPENTRGNANFIGRVLFAGNRVFALDGNNGMAAFTVVAPVQASVSLAVSLSGANIELSWPVTAAGFLLQKTSRLSPAEWANVAKTPAVVNGRNTIAEAVSDSTAFYRLVQP